MTLRVGWASPRWTQRAWWVAAAIRLCGLLALILRIALVIASWFFTRSSTCLRARGKFLRGDTSNPQTLSTQLATGPEGRLYLGDGRIIRVIAIEMDTYDFHILWFAGHQGPYCPPQAHLKWDLPDHQEAGFPTVNLQTPP
eukprot:scaffold26176_cov18-Prasinocladus_malaysianus.AAC.1